MKVAIMQPYFFPYIGYFQLIKTVDKFIVYDNIKYTKKGWINRNRLLFNGKEQLFTIPIRKGSDSLDICQRELSENCKIETTKILERIRLNYRKAPYFNEVYPLTEKSFFLEDTNLFRYIFFSLQQILAYLGIRTEILISSKIGVEERLAGENRVISICKHLNASQYINSIGGVALYSRERFSEEGIILRFLKSNQVIYKQFDNEFIPSLSILDVMMFNSPQKICEMLNQYELV